MAVNPEVLTDRMFYSQNGQIIVSAIFGAALALLFQRICKDRKCIVINAPPLESISDNVYQIDEDCFKYTPETTKCPKDRSKIVKNVSV